MKAESNIEQGTFLLVIPVRIMLRAELDYGLHQIFQMRLSNGVVYSLKRLTVFIKLHLGCLASSWIGLCWQ